MFGKLKEFFGGERADIKCSEIVKALETAVNEHNESKAVDSAARLRNHIKSSKCFLTEEEKKRVVKSLNRAKVGALMDGTPEGFSAFSCLDSISNDVAAIL
jgi:hypothetical protein